MQKKLIATRVSILCAFFVCSIVQCSRNYTNIAHFYAQARPAYPSQLFELILNKIAKQPKEKYIDLGCGTGELLIPLAKHFEHSIGVDPDAAMLLVAQEKIQAIHDTQTSVIQKTSEEFFSTLSEDTKFDLATAGRSLPWMDQKSIAQEVYTHLHDEGIFAVVMDAGGSFWKTDTIWFNAVRPIIFEGFPQKKPFVPIKGVNMSLDILKDTLKQIPFKSMEIIEISMQKQWDIQSIINLFYSGTGFLDWLAQDKEEFEHRVTQTLLALSPEGKFQDKVKFEVILCSK